jgi:hypothetical protein
MIPSLIAAGLFPQKASAITPGLFLDRKDSKPTLFERFRLQHKFTLAGHRSHSSHSSHSSHRSSSGGGYSAPRSYSTPSPSYSAPVYRAPTPLYSPPAEAAPSYAAPAVAPTPEMTTSWVLNGATGRTAWLTPFFDDEEGKMQQFAVGDFLSGVGTIIEISQVGGKWRVVTNGGTIIQNSSSSSVTPAYGAPADPASKPSVLPGNSNKFRQIVIQVQTALFTYGYFTGTIDGVVGAETKA